MELFILCKLIFQMRMRNHPEGLDLWFLVRSFVHFHTLCANSEGSGETARMRRLAWAFAGRLCDKYHNLMRWLISYWSDDFQIFWSNSNMVWEAGASPVLQYAITPPFPPPPPTSHLRLTEYATKIVNYWVAIKLKLSYLWLKNGSSQKYAKMIRMWVEVYPISVD